MYMFIVLNFICRFVLIKMVIGGNNVGRWIYLWKSLMIFVKNFYCNMLSRVNVLKVFICKLNLKMIWKRRICVLRSRIYKMR